MGDLYKLVAYHDLLRVFYHNRPLVLYTAHDDLLSNIRSLVPGLFDTVF